MTPDELRELVKEMAREGVNGWPNTALAAADAWEADRHALVVAGDTAMALSKRLEAAEWLLRDLNGIVGRDEWWERRAAWLATIAGEER